MWKKRQKKNSRLLKIAVFIVAMVFLGLFFTVFKSNFFTIKKIDIQAKDMTCVGENQLKVSSGLLGSNFFLIKSDKVKNDLKKKFVCIKSVAISKFLPDKINLKIQNRQAFAVLALLINEATFSATPSARDIMDYELVDNEGIIFGKAFNGLNLPQIFIYGSKENIQPALKILEKLKTLGLEINKSWINKKVFVINSNPPVSRISFLLDNDIDVQLASLQLILNKAKIDSEVLEFIDLRFDKPVVRFAPK